MTRSGDIGPGPSYLRGLSYIVFPDAGAPSDLRIFLEFASKAKLEVPADVRFQHIEFYRGTRAS
jgi:hypothetical protein